MWIRQSLYQIFKMFSAKSFIWAPMMILSKISENIFCNWKSPYFNDQRLKVFCGIPWFFFGKFRYNLYHIGGDGFPGIFDWKFFRDFSASNIPNLHRRDWGFLTGDFFGSQIPDPQPRDFKSPEIFWSSPKCKMPIPKPHAAWGIPEKSHPKATSACKSKS